MSVERHDLDELLKVGCPALLHVDPSETDSPRHPSVIRGWQKGHYVLLALPVLGGHLLFMKRQRTCAIRFLSGGSACGFESMVLDSGSKEQPHFKVAWPKNVSVLEVRKHERIDVRTQVKISLGPGHVLEGEMRDLSLGGCRLVSETEVAEQTTGAMSFVLPDGTTMESVPAVVRNVHRTREGYCWGCSFETDEEDSLGIRSSIDFFISTTLERLRLKTESSKRVLFIGESETTESELPERLGEMGYNVTLAAGVVDGFFRLRMAAPSLIFADFSHADLPGCEICRIIHQTRGFESIPIFLYGGTAGGLGDEARQAGAAEFLPSLEMVGRIASLVEEYIGLTSDDEGVAASAAPAPVPEKPTEPEPEPETGGLFMSAEASDSGGDDPDLDAELRDLERA